MIRLAPSALAIAFAVIFAHGAALGSSAEALVAEGNQLLAGRDYDGAIARFGRAQAMRPNAPEVDLGLGFAHFRKGEHDRAAEYFLTAAGKADGSLASIARFNRANALAKQGLFEDALDEYRRAMEADPANDDARHNYELVRAHLARLDEAEKNREELEAKLREAMEELTRELAELVELQARVLADTWATDPASRGEPPAEEDMERLRKGEAPPESSSKFGRAVAMTRGKPGEAASAPVLAAMEEEAAKRAGKAAEKARDISAMLGDEAGEHPIARKMQTVMTLLSAGAREVDLAKGLYLSDDLSGGEERAAAGLWLFVLALGESARPPDAGQSSVPEELKKLLERLAELRRRQGEMVADIWRSLPGSRGQTLGLAAQREFWGEILAGRMPSDEDRAAMARLEIEIVMSGGGAKRSAASLSSAQSELAGTARSLASEAEAVAAGGGSAEIAELVGAIRRAAGIMDSAAKALAQDPPDGTEAEPAAVAAFVALGRAPEAIEALIAETGRLLADQAMRVLDTWKSEPSARGPAADEADLKSLKEAGADGPLPAELEAKLGRGFAAQAEKAGAGAAKPRTKVEAALLQNEQAVRARELADAARKLASEGARPGEMNQASAGLDVAAGELLRAAGLMESAGDGLESSFAQAEPAQARAVTALARALAALAQAGSESAGEKGERGEPEASSDDAGSDSESNREEAGETKDEDADAEGDERPGNPESSENEKARAGDAKKDAEEITRQQAERLLEEYAQDERDLRRDIRKRRGDREAEVRYDW